MKTWLFTTFLLILIVVVGFFSLSSDLNEYAWAQKQFTAASRGAGIVGDIANKTTNKAISLGAGVLNSAKLGYAKVSKALGPNKEDVPLRQYAYQGAVRDGENRARLAYPKQSSRHLESTTALPTDITESGTQANN
jgi:hypothetical protein